MILMRPVHDDYPVSSPFGRQRVINGKLDVHKGIDFAVPVSTPVYAAVDGVVERCGWEDPRDPKRGYGLRVMERFVIDGITHFCWYGHLNLIEVHERQEIKRGQLVGYSGNTGRSTGPHLHFGIRRADSDEYMGCEFSPCEPRPRGPVA